ncbi:solute carrier family 28 member 3-like [Haliotis cracherodii]|uniref:solute carrier family 28 member 3-like n=1 Tax=Haliotis cracherodii TaxID=6455 RepID=UPI0039E97CC7
MTDSNDPGNDSAPVTVKDVGIDMDTDNTLDFDDNCWSSAIMRLQNSVCRFIEKHKGKMIAVVKGLLLLLYLAYFGYCMYYKLGLCAEVPLLVRPYLKHVTEAELHAIMTCGFASVSGGILGSYIQLGVPANHLLSAAVMSAPAALAVTKLMCPETKKSYFRDGVKMELGLEKHRNILSVLPSSAVEAVKIIANIIASMIAFVAMLKCVDKTVELFGRQAGFSSLSFGLVCSYLFYPISYVMGVATQDCGKMGELLGIKIFGTSTISFSQLGIMKRNRQELLDYVTTHNDTWHWQGSDVILEATNQTLLYGIVDKEQTGKHYAHADYVIADVEDLWIQAP